MLTSEHPDQCHVLQKSSPTPPPRVLTTNQQKTNGLTEKEREIFYRLLVDLFVDNPQRKKP